MTRNEFAARLAQGPLLLDGATGSNLMKAGMPKGVCAETWILDHPQAILELQRAYVAAGSQVLLAPTFTAGRMYLSQHGLEGELKGLNRCLVALSREAAQGKAWVAGDMTTMGRADVPYETMLEYYHEQAQALAEAGVDLILCETLMGHDEAMAALEGCRMAAAELPVCCSFSVTADGMLYFGGQRLRGRAPGGGVRRRRRGYQLLRGPRPAGERGPRPAGEPDRAGHRQAQRRYAGDRRPGKRPLLDARGGLRPPYGSPAPRRRVDPRRLLRHRAPLYRRPKGSPVGLCEI